VPHGNSIVNSYGIELSRETTFLFNDTFDVLANIVKMCMSGTNCVNEFTMAITGRPKCSSFIPLARQRLLAPAIRLPSVVVADLNRFCISFGLKLLFIKKAFSTGRERL